jgi:20S proteasome alpha/beta subunit
MTLVVSTITSSGIVLTADSRQTYRNQGGVLRVGSDSAIKIFKLNGSCGVAISGRAFLKEDKQSSKDVGYFIERFRENENLNDLSTKEIAQKICKHLADIFVEREFENLKNHIEGIVKKNGGKNLNFSPNNDNLIPYSYTDQDGKFVSDTGWIETIQMIVAGIDKDKIGRAYSVLIPKGITNEKDTESCGAMWIGQTDVISRIVKGYAREIEKLEFVKDSLGKNPKQISDQLNKVEYIINWGTITLQDAIDFCVLMTKTTENIQRFSDGTILSPGGISGVGGEIDVAVITPKSGFTWLKRKDLKAEGSTLSLDLEAITNNVDVGNIS